MTWKAGQSGNPAGGPTGPKRFQAAVDRALAQDDGKRLRAAVEKMLDAAAAGEVWAINFLADRLDGKAAQTVQVVRNARELSDSELADIAAGGSEGTALPSPSAPVPTGIH